MTTPPLPPISEVEFLFNGELLLRVVEVAAEQEQLGRNEVLAHLLVEPQVVCDYYSLQPLLELDVQYHM